MTVSDRPTVGNPTCKRCGRFLRTEEERQRQYCMRCPLPPPKPADARGDDRLCCGSDPPCPSCPYVIGWGDE
jgi:hypothetical protein